MDELKILSEEYKDAFISHFMCKWGASKEVAELEYAAHAEGFDSEDTSDPIYEADECAYAWGE